MIQQHIVELHPLEIDQKREIRSRKLDTLEIPSALASRIQRTDSFVHAFLDQPLWYSSVLVDVSQAAAR